MAHPPARYSHKLQIDTIANGFIIFNGKGLNIDCKNDGIAGYILDQLRTKQPTADFA